MNDHNQSPGNQLASDSINIIHWFNPSTHRASEEVAFAIAHASDVEPTELPFLMDGLDPDALDALIRDGSHAPEFSLQASMECAGYTVTVDSSGCVELEYNG